MKLRMFAVIFFLFLSIMTFAQKKVDKINKKKFKKLKSNVELKEKVTIRKPDITKIIKRKESTEVYDLKIDINEIIRNSNKLLY